MTRTARYALIGVGAFFVATVIYGGTRVAAVYGAVPSQQKVAQVGPAAPPLGQAPVAEPVPLPPAASASLPSPSPSSPAASAPASPSSPPPSGSTAVESTVVNLVNQERSKAGCGPLKVDSRLITAARGHSKDMATRGYFSHTTPEGVTSSQRVTRAGYRWQLVGENIAAGQTTPAAVMTAWMNSPGHRANILNCKFRDIGVGVATNGAGRRYWTQNFGTLL